MELHRSLIRATRRAGLRSNCSKITATGTVYNLDKLAYFPGAYVQGRYGMAIGDVSPGKLWLKNSHGVVMELHADRKGLALSLGGDAIYIDLD